MKPKPGENRHPVIFVLPTTLEGQQGPVAAWLNTAAWAASATKLGHTAHVITRSGVLGVDDLRRRAGALPSTPRGSLAVARRLPEPIKVFIKDVREWKHARSFNRFVSTVHELPESCEFVWQRHELFHYAGLTLADRLSSPLVAYVAAAKVWEARSWGVTRPGWGSWAERVGERGFLQAADLVACVSEEVADAVVELGVDSSRLMVTPSTVDTDLFTLDSGGAQGVKSELGLEDRFIIGWVGSFRSFHGLAVLVEAFAKVLATFPSAVLLLVGDGPERARVSGQVEHLGIKDNVVFLGVVPQPELPAVIGIMNITVVPGVKGGQFHYSPLKLWEYLAMERPVIAPRVGSPSRMLSENDDAILVEPGEPSELADAIVQLAHDAPLRMTLGRRGRAKALAHSWAHQFERVRERLRRVGARSAAGR